MVHVLLSMDKPVGSEGETLQVAPLTLVMSLPESLAVLASYWKVMLVMARPVYRPVPSTLGTIRFSGLFGSVPKASSS